MGQDQDTGAAGDAFGRQTAPLIAKGIGAELIGTESNEARYRGARVVIKCAGPKTSSVGVTYMMLERLDKVIAAFQRKDGSFDVTALPAQVFKAEMRETRSRGASAGKVGLVSKKIFEDKGERLGKFRVP